MRGRRVHIAKRPLQRVIVEQRATAAGLEQNVDRRP